MIRVKGGENKEANYMASAMGKALGGGKAKMFGGDKVQIANDYEAVSIRAGKSYADSNEKDTAESKPKDELAEGELGASKDVDSDIELFGDEEGELERLRQERKTELVKQGAAVLKYRTLGHGGYTHISEAEFLPTVTKSKLVVCHFTHQDFERCKLIDKHLQILAPRYLPVRFVFIDAEKAMFFVDKLKIKTLPTVVMFRDGVAVDRVVGFEDLGGDDGFATEILEERMKKSRVLRALKADGEDDEEELEEERTRKLRLRASNRGAVAEDEES